MSLLGLRLVFPARLKLPVAARVAAWLPASSVGIWASPSLIDARSIGFFFPLLHFRVSGLCVPGRFINLAIVLLLLRLGLFFGQFLALLIEALGDLLHGLQPVPRVAGVGVFVVDAAGVLLMAAFVIQAWSDDSFAGIDALVELLPVRELPEGEDGSEAQQ